MKNKICIYGAGGFSRETLTCLIDSVNFKTPDLKIKDIACFMMDDNLFKETHIMGIPAIPLSEFNPGKYEVVVTVGDPSKRKKLVEKLPAGTKFASIIHPTVVMSEWVEIGEGAIITAGVILTCNIKIGKHCHLNLHTTVGHECVIGDYFTTAPATNISGNCKFGNQIYFGTNSAVKDRIHICDNVTIGMGGIVVKDINEPGIYVGNPVRKLK